MIISSITAPIAVLIREQYGLLDQCHNASLLVAHETQSGVYTVVGNVSEANLMCYGSFAHVNLKSYEDRSNYTVTLYFVNQNDLKKSLLIFNNSDDYFNLGMITRHRIFDEYYAPNYFGVKNYFLNASITLDIDVSSNFSTSELFVCFFQDKDTYSNEVLWRSTNYCRSAILESGEHCNISETFVADQPSFWYIGIASNSTVDVHRIWLRGTGYSISGIIQNSTQPTICAVDRKTISQKNISRFGVCILDGFSVLDNKPINQDLYLVAYEKDDPERNYFTTVNVKFKSRDFSYPVRTYTIGVAVANLSLTAFFFVVILIIILLPFIKSKFRRRYPTQEQEEDQSPDNGAGPEGSFGRAEAHPSSSGHYQIEQSGPAGNETVRVEHGNLPSQGPECEPQTSKTVEDYSANPSFGIGYQASINN